MDKLSFEKLVGEVGFSPVPEKFRDKLSNVVLTIEDEPDNEIRQSEHLGPDETLLGLYVGVPLPERGEYYGVGMTLPDRIILFRLPILAAAKEDKISVRIVVEETIWHEVGHHFGLSEEDIASRTFRQPTDSF